MRDEQVATGLDDGPLSKFAWGLALIYLAGVFLSGTGSPLPARVLPRALAYFTQISRLFPHALTTVIDYRAEGYLCEGARWVEIDVRPYFPIDADDKESRFQRVMFFYREDRTTMRALEAYLMERHNGGSGEDGAPRTAIGGVRLLSLRIPFARPGEPEQRYRRRPLGDYPEDERKIWYYTPAARREERCRK